MAKTKFKFIKILIGTVFLSLVLFNFSYAKADFSSDTIVSLTNSTREKNGLGALSVNSQLAAAAYAKAQDMLNKDYFSHTSPNGTTPWDFIKNAGYTYAYAGENLAIGYADANELFNAWMASASHRANILNPNFREIGVAVISGDFEGSETLVTVQEFGASGQSGEVASEESAPTSNSENAPKPASQASNNQFQFQFVRDKSAVSPQSIYAGEDVNFQITITGEVNSLELKIGEQKINVLETSSVTGTKEKTYELKQKIEKDGSFDVLAAGVDKAGNSQELNMGKLEVKPTTIIKNTTEKQTSLFAGFQNSLKAHWLIYLIVFGGAGLVLLGFIVFRKAEFGKKLIASWKF